MLKVVEGCLPKNLTTLQEQFNYLEDESYLDPPNLLTLHYIFTELINIIDKCLEQAPDNYHW